MEKLSRPFSFHPLVFPDLAQLQREIRPQEHPRVARRRPALFVSRLASRELRRSLAECWVARRRPALFVSRLASRELRRSLAECWVARRRPVLFAFRLCSHREPHL